MCRGKKKRKWELTSIAKINFGKTDIWSLKRIFVARVCSITKFTYLLTFLVWNSISCKKLTFLYRKNMCWYNRTIQQHGAKTFHKLLYLVSNFFSNLNGWRKSKVQNHNDHISSKTFSKQRCFNEAFK